MPGLSRSKSEGQRVDDFELDRVHTINSDGNNEASEEKAIRFPALPVRTASHASTEELQSQFRGSGLTFSRLGRMA